MDPLRVPLATAVQSRVVGHASVWAWAGIAFDEGSDAEEWFAKYLGKPCKLVRFDTGKLECFQIFISIEQYNELHIDVSFYNSAESQIRSTNPAYASDFKISFPDGYPFLVISQVIILASFNVNWFDYCIFGHMETNCAVSFFFPFSGIFRCFE